VYHKHVLTKVLVITRILPQQKSCMHHYQELTKEVYLLHVFCLNCKDTSNFSHISLIAIKYFVNLIIYLKYTIWKAMIELNDCHYSS